MTLLMIAGKRNSWLSRLGHRKRGSKSRKCSLPSDNLTKKQWKERNGKTLSINLNQPTSWEIFKEVSKPTQEEYLNHLLAIYGANATSLAAMFHVQPLTIRRFIQTNGLAVKFPVGHSMNAEQREAWGQFLKGEVKPASAPVQPVASRASVPDKDEIMSMKKVSLSFSGKINASMIVNSLLQILGENGIWRCGNHLSALQLTVCGIIDIGRSGLYG